MDMKEDAERTTEKITEKEVPFWQRAEKTFRRYESSGGKLRYFIYLFGYVAL